MGNVVELPTEANACVHVCSGRWGGCCLKALLSFLLLTVSTVYVVSLRGWRPGTGSRRGREGAAENPARGGEEVPGTR